MNNEQFRKLVLTNTAKPAAGQNDSISPAKRSATTTALGSRQRSSIPMTPRSVAGNAQPDFARQLAERNNATPTQKKLRSSMPKGSKLAQGYVDRAKTRLGEDEDDKVMRLAALEESLKKEEIDQVTFDRLRDEIAGGDLSSTHLVKGLDFKLLERVKRGEDVFSDKRDAPENDPGPEPEEPADVDDELEKFEVNEVRAIDREKVQKKGQLPTASPMPGQKRTRDQILADMKAARYAAKAKNESTLGSRFKKIGERQKPGTRIERDRRGREILIIVDEDGHERRKVRKLEPSESKEQRSEAFVPDKKAEVLGMEVPEFYRKQQEKKEREDEEKEFNILDDAGSDYDPLGGLGDISGEDSSDEDTEGRSETIATEAPVSDGEKGSRSPASNAMPPPPKKAVPGQPRNYFKDSKTALASAEARSAPSLSDPAVIAALRKAKALNAASKAEDEEKATGQEARLKEMLQNSSRDNDDLDMGFGTNRLEDEEDLEETKVKLSAWGDEDGDDGRGGGGKSKRRRGPKKRKGDAKNAADVLGVIARRKAEAK